MRTFTTIAREGAMFAALAGMVALSMLFARGMADAVVSLGEMAMR